MNRAWGDVVARARGLGTHFLGGSVLRALSQAPDLPAMAAVLAAHGYLVPEADRGSAAAIELAARRQAAARLRTLARWCGPRTVPLTVVFEDEDRRSLRALLRGAVQGVPADARLSGLVPTPSLPERALRALASQPTARAVVSTLAIWKNPYARLLAPEVAGHEPDLLRLETAVNRTFAMRALHGARLAGRRGVLLDHVREMIDIENAYVVLALAAGRAEDVPDAFLPGGGRLTRERFAQALAAGATARAVEVLLEGLGPDPVGAALRAGVTDPEGVEQAVLRAQIAGLRRRARHEPLGPAPVLHYALRLRAEVLDVCRVVWGRSLGVPGLVIRDGLVTAP